MCTLLCLYHRAKHLLRVQHVCPGPIHMCKHITDMTSLQGEQGILTWGGSRWFSSLMSFEHFPGKSSWVGEDSKEAEEGNTQALLFSEEEGRGDLFYWLREGYPEIFPVDSYRVPDLPTAELFFLCLLALPKVRT